MTLFGMSEKKKRGIVVPVMALAVCAVAMVGLGFALETSVTSSSNDVKTLAVDLDSNSSNLEKFDAGEVNGLFEFTFQTNKEHVSNPDKIRVTYTLNQKVVYLKVFDNFDNNGTQAQLSVSSSELNGAKFYLLTGEETTSEKILTVGTGNVDVSINTVYKLALKSIDGIEFNGNSTAFKDYDVDSEINLSTISNFSLQFTATVTPQAS